MSVVSSFDFSSYARTSEVDIAHVRPPPKRRDPGRNLGEVAEDEDEEDEDATNVEGERWSAGNFKLLVGPKEQDALFTVLNRRMILRRPPKKGEFSSLEELSKDGNKAEDGKVYSRFLFQELVANKELGFELFDRRCTDVKSLSGGHTDSVFLLSSDDDPSRSSSSSMPVSPELRPRGGRGGGSPLQPPQQRRPRLRSFMETEKDRKEQVVLKVFSSENGISTIFAIELLKEFHRIGLFTKVATPRHTVALKTNLLFDRLHEPCPELDEAIARSPMPLVLAMECVDGKDFHGLGENVQQVLLGSGGLVEALSAVEGVDGIQDSDVGELQEALARWLAEQLSPQAKSELQMMSKLMSESMPVFAEIQALVWLLGENDVLPLSYDGYGNFGNLMWDTGKQQMMIIDFAANAAKSNVMHFLDVEQKESAGPNSSGPALANFEGFVERWRGRFRFPYLEAFFVGDVQQRYGSRCDLSPFFALQPRDDSRNMQRFMFALFRQFTILNLAEEAGKKVSSAISRVSSRLVDAVTGQGQQDVVDRLTQHLENVTESLQRRLRHAQRISLLFSHLYEMQIQSVLVRPKDFLTPASAAMLAKIRRGQNGFAEVPDPKAVSDWHSSMVVHRTLAAATGISQEAAKKRIRLLTLGFALGATLPNGSLAGPAARSIAVFRSAIEHVGHMKPVRVCTALLLLRAFGLPTGGTCTERAAVSSYEDEVLLDPLFEKGDGTAALLAFERAGFNGPNFMGAGMAVLTAALLGWHRDEEEIVHEVSDLAAIVFPDPRCIGTEVACAILLRNLLIEKAGGNWRRQVSRTTGVTAPSPPLSPRITGADEVHSQEGDHLSDAEELDSSHPIVEVCTAEMQSAFDDARTRLDSTVRSSTDVSMGPALTQVQGWSLVRKLMKSNPEHRLAKQYANTYNSATSVQEMNKLQKELNVMQTSAPRKDVPFYAANITHAVAALHTAAGPDGIAGAVAALPAEHGPRAIAGAVIGCMAADEDELRAAFGSVKINAELEKWLLDHADAVADQICYQKKFVRGKAGGRRRFGAR